MDCLLWMPKQWIVCCGCPNNGLFVVDAQTMDCLLWMPKQWIVCCGCPNNGLFVVDAQTMDCLLWMPKQWIVCCGCPNNGMFVVDAQTMDCLLWMPKQWTKTNRNKLFSRSVKPLNASSMRISCHLTKFQLNKYSVNLKYQ